MESATTTGGTPQETDAIADMFDESSDMSEVFNDGQVHLSYWYDEEDEAPLIEAAQRLTRKVADSLGLREGDRVLDVGCGLGAPPPARHRVRGAGHRRQHQPPQVAEARARARKAGLADQVDFHLGDYGSLDLPDDSFDAVVAMESLVYVADLGHTLGSLRRVMRPGARLSLAEPTREGLGVVAAAGFAADFGAKWLLSVEDWLGPLREAGFEPMEYLQCGPRVFGMGPKYLHAVDVRREELAARFGGAAVDELRGTLETFFAPGASRIGYAIITARKPRD
ncbi:SAM-dependent methyltransferase [Streptomyces sp. DfronAA-171]|uniref:SAM-dependent methyltransferase n=1 Tax=Streptomyces sp. DfronAA-171 TaxID=1839777 RepID=UPI00081F73F3|nr:methyltransferase domain-containing protein [Streptomyces sp. DfronAA-171]SCE60116.1 27-O-demethylrifamycin SV methyltransferase [Streptomyces sp. DfronAA-171]